VTTIRDRVIELVRIPANTVKPHPGNWRTHSPEQREVLRGMFDEVGFAGALIAYDDPEWGMTLIDGHLRQEEVDARRKVPVLKLDLTRDEAMKMLATYDPVGAMAGLNEDRLRALLGSVSVASDNVRAMLDSLLPKGPVEGLTDPDALQEPSATPVSRTGDVWLCEAHRVLCGDATDGDAVAGLLAGRKPLLMVTDPPYGVNYDPMWREVLGHAPRRTIPVENDDRADWADAWRLFPGSVVYCWSAPAALLVTSGLALQVAGFEIRASLIWRKPNFPISRGPYTFQHEPCWYAVRKGSTAHWIGSRSETTVWDISLDRNVEGGHSTQKPVECMERPIRNHDAPEVYDPFLGSGTTLIAAERQERTLYGIDIDPRWTDVAVRRWEAFTGKTATLESTDSTFAEIQEGRLAEGS
jgi:DNA modification methylase